MDIRDSSVLILGGYGLVGQAVARRLLPEAPSRLILLSLKREEAEEAVRGLQPEAGGTELEPAWGDIFAFDDVKDVPRAKIYGESAGRRRHVESLLATLDANASAEYYLHKLIMEKRSDVIIDAVNTATGIAYQDIYKASRLAYDAVERGQDLDRAIETWILTNYLPQLIRHVQVLYQAMCAARTRAYIKIGTSGTGGMGLNIPYTHSEEKPSRVLLSKSALAGAHTMLLFLLARTPGGPITKEIKPAAAIAWKRVGYGKVLRRGKPVPLYDVDPDQAMPLLPVGSFSRRIRGSGPQPGPIWRTCSSTPARTASSLSRSSPRLRRASRWSS